MRGRETDIVEATSRTDGDLRYEAFATSGGLTAIGVDTDCTDGSGGPRVAANHSPGPAWQIKSVAELTRLERDAGGPTPFD